MDSSLANTQLYTSIAYVSCQHHPYIVYQLPDTHGERENMKSLIFIHTDLDIALQNLASEYKSAIQEKNPYHMIVAWPHFLDSSLSPGK